MISALTTAPANGPVIPVPPGRQAVHELSKSLRSGDLDAARQAYADVIRNAPEGATWQKGSSFAQVGKALVQGDLEAAKSAFADAIKGRISDTAGRDPATGPVGNPVPAPSTTGGASGSLLNVVA